MPLLPLPSESRHLPTLPLRWQTGITSLYWAAQKGHAAIVRLLLEHRAEVDAADEVPPCAMTATPQRDTPANPKP